MTTQLIICIAMFVAMLLGFLLLKLPLGTIAGTIAVLLVVTGCTEPDTLQGRWPLIIVVFLWAIFIAPKVTLDAPVVPIASLETKKKETKPLGKFADVSGVVIFMVVILTFVFNKYVGLPTWLLALAGVLAMIITGTLTKGEAIKAIPVDICLLFVGSNTMATALVQTGTADFIGSLITKVTGGTTSTVILYSVFFIVPFLVTQFMQNQSVMNVFAPIALIACSAIGADPRGCLVLITAGSLTAYMTPSATAVVPMCMEAGGYNVRALFKMGWLLAVLLTVGYVGYVSLVMPAL